MAGKVAKFLCKTHKAEGKTILAVCDAGLLGKKIRFNDIDFDVSEPFYGGKGSDGDGVIGMVGKSDIVNVVGKGIVDLLIREGLVDEHCVLWMGEVPHVQIIRV